MNNNHSVRIALIMAGGSGERFWPISRKNHPKQFLCLADKSKTLLEQAIENVLQIFPSDKTFIVTGQSLLDATKNKAIKIPAENIIAEPMKRNTAGCLIYVTAFLLSKYGKEAENYILSVIPSDHKIGQPEIFNEILRKAMIIAEKEKALITIGITPSRPETGYGYLERSSEKITIEEIPDNFSIHKVSKFHEKPSIQKAKEYLDSGNFLWNSGMFVWKLSYFMEELEKVKPEMVSTIYSLAESLKKGNYSEALSLFHNIEDVSIDYALMEKAENVITIKGDFDWDDIGSWTALERSLSPDENSNVVFGNPVILDSKNCIVYNEPGAEKLALAVIGVEGLAVVATEDGVLVVPKDRVQEIRKVVEKLKESNAKQL